MNSIDHPTIKVYRFPSNEINSQYAQHPIRIETIRKKVVELARSRGKESSMMMDYLQKTKSEREVLLSSVEKDIKSVKNSCQLPKIRSQQKQDPNICDQPGHCLSIKKIYSKDPSRHSIDEEEKFKKKTTLDKKALDLEPPQIKQQKQKSKQKSQYFSFWVKPDTIYISPSKPIVAQKSQVASPKKKKIITNITSSKTFNKNLKEEKSNQMKNFFHSTNHKKIELKKRSPDTSQKNERRNSTSINKKYPNRNSQTHKPNQSFLKNRLHLTLKVNKRFQHDYCSFLDFVSCVHGIYLHGIQWTSGNFKVFVGKGNNDGIISSILKRRNWWIEVNNIQDAHFVWTQFKNVSILEGFESIVSSNKRKSGRIKSSVNVYVKNDSEQKIQSYVNNLTQEEKFLLPEHLENHKKSNISFDPASIKVQINKSDLTLFSYEAFLKRRKIHNHFINNYHLSHKKYLFKNLKSYYEEKGEDPFNYIPLTFHVQEPYDDEWKRYIECANGKWKEALWIIKPGENSNRGMGIRVEKDQEQIKKIVKDNSGPTLNKQRTTIIQLYIMPLLYQRRKFDFRCFLLVLQVGSRMRGYWYEEGYGRTASKEFSLINFRDRYVHLTNDAIQKKSEDYGKYEVGNKLSFTEIEAYLKSNYGRTNFYQLIHEKMIKLAYQALDATCEKLNPDQLDFCFEIFGLDYMIDENFKIWLIEVNTNPCLETSTTLLYRIIVSMIENVFKIVVDPLFRGSNQTIRNNRWLEKDPFKTNKFRVIFDRELQKKKSLNHIKQEQ